MRPAISSQALNDGLEHLLWIKVADFNPELVNEWIRISTKKELHSIGTQPSS